MSYSQKLTVIGPELETSSNKILVPPPLTTETDNLQWREMLREMGGHRCTMRRRWGTKCERNPWKIAMILYQYLETGLKEQVREAVRSGNLILKN